MWPTVVAVFFSLSQSERHEFFVRWRLQEEINVLHFTVQEDRALPAITSPSLCCPSELEEIRGEHERQSGDIERKKFHSRWSLRQRDEARDITTEGERRRRYRQKPKEV